MIWAAFLTGVAKRPHSSWTRSSESWSVSPTASAVHKSALVTLSLISVDMSAGWAENQKIAVMITSAGIHARYFFIIRILSF